MMLDNCDSGTRAVIDAAIGTARRLGHHHIGTEHALIALAERRDVLPSAVASLLPDAGTLTSALPAMGGARRDDHDLLAAVGVDLDQVRAAARRTFGDDTVERLGHRAVLQSWQPWRRPHRRCVSLLAGSLAIAPRLKQALERATDAAGSQQRQATPTDLLMAMLSIEGAMASWLLETTGVDPLELQRAVADSRHP